MKTPAERDAPHRAGHRGARAGALPAPVDEAARRVMRDILVEEVEVGAPHDAAEHEADALARRAVPPAGPSVHLAATAADDVRPLDAALLPSLEGLLGASLGDVRVHEGPRADAASRSLGARAFTLGRDIWLGAGESAGDLRLLAHEAAHVVQQSRRGADAPALVQRQTADRRDATADTGASGAEPVALTEAQRVELRRVTGDRMGLAYTAYVSACKDHKQAIKEVARQEAEFLALLADVAMGFAAPAIARRLVATAAQNLPDATTNAYFRAAFVAMGSDNLKAIFTGAVKAGNVGLKANYRRLAGETEVDQFIGKLETVTQHVFAQINEGLPKLSDRDLTAVCATYDSSAANVDVYRDIIGDLIAQFRSQIERIDTGGSLADPKGRVVIIDFGARGKGYALVRQAMKPMAFAFMPDPDRYQFMTGITDEMKSLAIAKSTAIHGPIETVPRNKVVGLPAGW